MNPIITCVLVACLGIAGLGNAAPPAEQILVFVASEGEIARNFAAEHLPGLRSAAEKLGIGVRVIDVAGGAPRQVTLTPLIVYQNHRGRSVFQARYMDPGKLVHFIRTSRVVPLENADLQKKRIAVLADGRSLTAAPIKVTGLTGHPPADLSPVSFRRRAETAIVDGFSRLELRRSVRIGPSNRLFYMDYHPFLSADGELSVSLALFSQFNCVEPVFRRFDDPITGPWEEADRIFAEAAAVLEAEMLRQISSSPIGDAFEPVPSAVPVVSWEDLQAGLPAAPEGAQAGAVEAIELPTRWSIETAEDSEPRLIFRFAAPLDRYTGEVLSISGGLTLSEDRSLRNATGWVEARAASVTMGEPDLDRAIHDKMIRVAEFPTSRFELLRFADDAPVLAFGKLSPIVAEGRFMMLGFEVPLEVTGQIEPIIGKDGAPRLRVSATATLSLANPFGIAGPDGPAPANDTLIFYLNFLMKEG